MLEMKTRIPKKSDMGALAGSDPTPFPASPLKEAWVPLPPRNLRDASEGAWLR